MEPSLKANARARAAVDAFLLSEGSSSDEDEGDSTMLVARPSRLGLGATEGTQNAPRDDAPNRARSRLERSIRSQKEKEENARNDEHVSDSESSDDGESRTRVVGSKRKRPRKVQQTSKVKKKADDVTPALEKPSELERQQAIVAESDVAGKSTSGEQNAEGEQHAPGSTKTHNWKERPGGFGESTWQGQEGPRQKRKKTRSRQKNLRRDKRPKESLPAHLTEATLLGGRLPRHDAVPGTEEQ